jgi:probable HAF family extracellular repeat protein
MAQYMGVDSPQAAGTTTMMNTSTWIQSAAALLLLSASAHARQSGWQVTITDLPLLPGGNYASAYGINDTGKIVGVATDSTGAYKDVQWLNGQISIIPDYSTSGLSVPDDLNDAGEIAGHVSISGFFSNAVWWDSQNNPVALPGLPSGAASMNLARAINASGQIVGRAKEGGPNYHGHAVVWYQGVLQADLGFMGGGTYSDAYGINDLGAVVGVASLASTNQHAFLWQNGQYTDLSTWIGGGASSWAYAINNLGDIVGLNSSVASLWHNGSVQALTMPAGLSAYTPVIDINDAGDMIATASAGYPIEVGVLWRNGTPINLGTLPGGTISRVRRINAAGEIVGEAQSANGFYHAVKWTVSSPSTAFCFGDGTALACPCGNNGSAGRGCQNSASTGGAVLASTGVASLASDTLVLHSSAELPTALSIVLQGSTTIAAAGFGDGLRCTAGTLKRLYVHNAAGGALSVPQAGEPSVSARSAALGDTITSGATRFYQTYYRDPVLTFCPNPPGGSWNISSGISIVWAQ